VTHLERDGGVAGRPRRPEGRAAVVVGAVRTPIGGYGGALSGVRPDDLAAIAIRAVVDRTSIPLEDVDDVWFGCANQAGEDNRNVARMAALLAGLPDSVPGVTVNRLCASGLSAVIGACHAVIAGDGDLFIAGGVESMSRAPFVLAKPDTAFPRGDGVAFDTHLGWRFPNPRLAAMFPLEAMGETAENVALRYGVTRTEQDAFALRSHQLWAAADEAGLFDEQLIPVGEFVRDEHPRRDTSLEKLARLRAAFREDGTVTAGNAAGINDGAAALVIASAEKADVLGLEPMAEFVAGASAGVDPQYMGVGPIPAVRRLFERTGITAADVDLVELNEAFAAQAIPVIRELDLDPDRVNVNGGAIALGHPLGMSGARLVVELVYGLRRRGARNGLASLCVGVGQGQAALFERSL
jgi:3-oxoadipyl-CoA thiolase